MFAVVRPLTVVAVRVPPETDPPESVPPETVAPLSVPADERFPDPSTVNLVTPDALAEIRLPELSWSTIKAAFEPMPPRTDKGAVVAPEPTVSEVAVVAPKVDSSISVPPIQLAQVRSDAVAAVPEILIVYVPELILLEKSPAVKLLAVSPANDDSSMFEPVIFPVSVELVKFNVNPVPVVPLVNVPRVVMFAVPAQVERAVSSTLPRPTFDLASEVIQAGSA